QAVIIDTESLSSLPARELSAGMAEVIKYGLICDAPFFSWLEDNIDDLMTLDSEKITHAIYESCRAKAEVVAQDEKEGGIRAILNLGHTFGHAIETEMGYGNWLHGEAVAAGTVLAVDLSWRLGSLTESDVERSVNLLAKANLPVLPPKGMSREAFIERMLLDKKVLDGSLRLILLQALGDAYVTSDFAMEDFNACLDDAIEAASA
ncbi:MAG: 3-dehydroquinate synthase, partial [Pseudomonadota bacterium]|nr:3-dehydroquinate synthase [Pseudomonadota bacterium]